MANIQQEMSDMPSGHGQIEDDGVELVTSGVLLHSTTRIVHPVKPLRSGY